MSLKFLARSSCHRCRQFFFLMTLCDSWESSFTAQPQAPAVLPRGRDRRGDVEWGRQPGTQNYGAPTGDTELLTEQPGAQNYGAGVRSSVAALVPCAIRLQRMRHRGSMGDSVSSRYAPPQVTSNPLTSETALPA